MSLRPNIGIIWRVKKEQTKIRDSKKLMCFRLVEYSVSIQNSTVLYCTVLFTIFTFRVGKIEDKIQFEMHEKFEKNQISTIYYIPQLVKYNSVTREEYETDDQRE